MLAAVAPASVQREQPIGLPSGGGAVRGISESFKANSATGSASFAIPLPVSNARGFEPDLPLAYDSGSGNGPFGLGWAVGAPSIRRRTEKGLPQYLDAEDSDTYLLGGGEELIPLLTESNGDWRPEIVIRAFAGVFWEVKLYRPRIEGGFARIERWRDPELGISWWRVTSPDNVTSVYGYRASARVADPDHPERVFSWQIDRQFDDKGHYTQYDYKPEDLDGVDLQQCFEAHRADRAEQPQRYLKRVLYGIKESTVSQGLIVEDLITTDFAPDRFHFQTVFDYGDHNEDEPQPEEGQTWAVRHDPFSTYRAGFEVRTWRRCRRILSFHQFENELASASELVQSVSLDYLDEPRGFSFLAGIRFTGHKRAEDGAWESRSLPELSFEYQEHAWDTEVRALDPDGVRDLPAGVDGRGYQWVDLRSEGLPGVLSEQGGGIRYKSNLGGGLLAEAQAISSSPSFLGLAAGKLQVRDLDANGVKQLVSLPARGFFTVGEGDQWGGFEPLSRMPAIDLDDPNLRAFDITGDGRADLVISEERAFRWYPSEGTDGYGEARQAPKPWDDDAGPAIVFANRLETIFLADMTGDSLTDIVRIRNSDLVYWPNLGYGRFGAKVVMADAPRFDHPDQFDPRRLRLADLDGSGLTDLVYLGRDQLRYWLNLNGNRWGEPVARISPFPDTDALTEVSVIDLMGSGTACVVWSSPAPTERKAPLRYLDLMSGRKPYLMVSYRNGMGKEVELEYMPSTHFYLEDKAKGEPWITRLHFPVQCLSKVETIDRVTGARFASIYSYHHGYYDHAEREFRGFGRVEQLDTEVFDHFVKGEFSNVVESALHQPPVLTKTWFHTGVFLDREHVLDQYRQEYFQSEALDGFRLPEPVLPDDLTTAEWREALRACKGLALRTEVYGLDATELEPFPYSVAETTAEIRRVQPKGEQRHGCFQLLSSEGLSLQLDRHPDDPRVSHNLVLASDPYGRPTVSASAGYGRFLEDATLPEEVRELQHRRHILVSTASVTGDDFGILGALDPGAPLETPYRLPAAWRTETWELITDLEGAGILLDRAGLLQEFENATPVGYEDQSRSPGTSRLLSRGETRFINEDLNGPRAPGEASPLGMTWQSYQLAITPALLSTIFGDKVDPSSFIGGYLDLNGDGDWWVPSGTPIFGLDAANRFYLPDGSRDPFGNPSWVVLDPYLLLPVSASDAKQNETLAVNDYRTLAPRLLRDPNHNWSAVEVDALGLVVASAAMGKVENLAEGEVPGRDAVCEGDNLEHPGTQLEYDLDAWTREQKPVWAKTTDWEEHWFVNPAREKTLARYEYTDGLGNVVMAKAQAEPGLARQVQGDGSVTEVDTGTLVPPGLRWVGNGRTVLNNKGNPVKQYEPYFAVTREYEDAPALVETGTTAILFYDAAGRSDCTLNPNHSYSKLVFSPWSQSAWDSNDTLFLKNPDGSIETNSGLDPDVGHHFTGLSEDDYLPTWYESRIDGALGPEEQRAAQITEARSHPGTPAVSHTDALGRTIHTLADNGPHGRYETLTRLDIEGNLLDVVDHRGNRVMAYRYNLLPPPDEETPKPTLYQDSMDGGERWTLMNVLGQPILDWDARGHLFEQQYDALNRPTEQWVTEGGVRKLVGLTGYRDSDHPDAEQHRAKNLLGAAFEVFDQAGRGEAVENDFKGNAIQATRTLAWDYKQTLSWDLPDRATLLESEQFTTSSEFDALNRVTLARSPHHAGIPASVTRPSYNESGGMDQMRVSVRGGSEDLYVENIDYDAKGQRQRIEYGNGVVTDYEYEPDTFRLKRIYTAKAAKVLQDLNYTYDPAGNITEIRDRAHQDIFFRNVRVEPHNQYEYDPLYRLTWAAGREHAVQAAFPDPESGWAPEPHPNDGQAMEPYVQTYEYDGVGNILQMAHNRPDSNTGWTRHYQYAETNNRLTGTTLGDPGLGFDQYTYNAHGSMIAMPQLVGMDWDYAEQFRHVDLVGGGNAYYVYDAGGQRTRKVIETNGSLIKERIYFGGWEIYRERNAGGLQLERETVHVMDDKDRIALIDTKAVDASSSNGFESVVRYQLGNHLGSASLELSDDGNVISYEEYHPYGTTAYFAGTAVVEESAKRYRYTGKERDEETGLSFYGARFLAPILARWLSCDPLGIAESNNLFVLVNDNPITQIDPDGCSAIGIDEDAGSMIFPGVFSGSESQAEILEHVERHGYTTTGGYFEWSDETAKWLLKEGLFEPLPGEILVESQEASIWNQGGGLLLGGLLLLGIGVLGLMTGGSAWFMAGAALALSGGLVGTGVGATSLALSYAGVIDEERAEQAASAGTLAMDLSSFGGLGGSLAGIALSNDTDEGLRTGAYWGSLAEGGLSLAYSAGRMGIREFRFGMPETMSWNRDTRHALQASYDVGDAASRSRPNDLMRGGIERIDLSHWISRRRVKGTGWEWFFNRPWNITPMWATEHALVDWYEVAYKSKQGTYLKGRWQFLSRRAKSYYDQYRYFGLQKQLKLMPPWMIESAVGAGTVGATAVAGEAR